MDIMPWDQKHDSSSDESGIAFIVKECNTALQFADMLLIRGDFTPQTKMRLQESIDQIHHGDPNLSPAVATENLLRLSSLLFKDLQHTLELQQQNYRARTHIIHPRLPDLDTLAQQEQTACLQQVSLAVEHARAAGTDEYDQAFAASWSRISSRLNRLGNDGFSYFIRYTVNNIINEEANSARKEIAAVINSLQWTIQIAIAETNKHFQQTYKRLAPVANIDLSLHVNSIDINIDISEAFADLTNTIDEFNRDDSWKRLEGAGLGAIIGTLVSPGMGTVIGGIVGSIFGSLLISVEKKRVELRARLLPTIRQLFSQANSDFKQALHSYHSMTNHLIEQQIATYVSHNKAIVAAVNLQQRDETELLRHLQQLSASNLAQIKTYEQTLERLRQQLARQTFT